MYISSMYTWIFLVLFLSWALSEIFGPVLASRRRRKETNHDHGTLALSMIIGPTSLILSFIFPLLLPWSRVPLPLFFWVGVVLVLIGVTWRRYAIRTLGEFFTAQLIVHDNQEVVQHGPYRYIRHPSYTGFLLLIIGFGFMIGSWLSVLLLLFGLGTMLLYRISFEEQELLRHCPSYRAYMQKTTKRLFPFLY